jgi:hypothetical protein
MTKKTFNTDDIIKFFKDLYITVINYFKSLSQDMIIAWAVLGVGVVVIVVSLFL